MTEIDLWEDEPLEFVQVEIEEPKKLEKSSIIPEVSGKQIVITIDDNEIHLFSKKDLTGGDFTNLIGMKEIPTEGNTNQYVTKFGQINAFVLRRALAGYENIISPEDGKKLAEAANKVPNPEGHLTEDGKHIEITVPGIKVYRDLLSKVNGYPTKTGYRVDITRLFDLEAMSETMRTKFPKIEFDRRVLQLNKEPIVGFDGTLSSLKDLPISSLNVVSANGQSWKALKTSKQTLAEKIESMGIKSLYDMLFWLPQRYIDKTKPQDISDLIEGETAVVIGKITDTHELSAGRGGAAFTITTSTGNTIRSTFFNQKWLISKFKVGNEVLITGKFSWWNKAPQISGASIEHAEEAAVLPIVPIYKQSPTKGITTYFLMAANRELLSRLGDIKLPTYLRQEGRMNYCDALSELHFPSSLLTHYEAVETLAYYELVHMQILIQDTRNKSEKKSGLSMLEGESRLQARAIRALPFPLTKSQKRAVVEINTKFSEPLPASILLNADVGAGKGLLETEQILTPTGYRLLKTIKTGDKVIGSNGKATTVTGVFPQGEQELAEIVFNDGTKITTDLSHLWTVKKTEDQNGEFSKVISTRELLETNEETYFSVNGKPQWQIPIMSAPFEPINNTKLLVDSYELGKSIGSQAESSSDIDIPEYYHHASSQSRIELLQGLLDSNGYLLCEDKVTFFSNSKKLSESLMYLVRSLGGFSYSHKENQVLIRSNGLFVPFKAEKKLYGYRAVKSAMNVLASKSIVSVRKLDEKQKTICIKVSAVDELFVTRDFIVTHNTVVAQLACLRAVDAGYQAVLVGPTEILARQLYEGFKRLLSDFNDAHGNSVSIDFISGSMKVRERKEIIAKVESGETRIVVGTQSAMTQINYENLGFVAIDEQQKFGAEQRSKLLESRADGLVPDIMMQSATPIPRSTAQVIYGDIDMIELSEKPPGRLPIITEWVEEDPNEFIEEMINPVWADIIDESEKGNQSFIITPLVQESDKIDSASVERTFKHLSAMALGSLNVGFVHGKMKQDDQQTVMKAFRNKEYDVLVSSTVVEVGVDIPDATRVVILSADRLGSASLHQIRGRVGRNSKQSKCYLVSLGKTENSQVRLQSLVDNDNGFDIAKADLELRGEGKMFSTEQSGRSEMIFASLSKHRERINEAKEEAQRILKSPFKEAAIKDSKEKFESNERLI